VKKLVLYHALFIEAMRSFALPEPEQPLAMATQGYYLALLIQRLNSPDALMTRLFNKFLKFFLIERIKGFEKIA